MAMVHTSIETLISGNVIEHSDVLCIVSCRSYYHITASSKQMEKRSDYYTPKLAPKHNDTLHNEHRSLSKLIDQSQNMLLYPERVSVMLDEGLYPG